jgi:hypothetical protein
VNKNVGRQRKWKQEKKHKGESRYRKSTNGRSRGIIRKEKGKNYRGNDNRGEIGD